MTRRISRAEDKLSRIGAAIRNRVPTARPGRMGIQLGGVCDDVLKFDQRAEALIERRGSAKRITDRITRSYRTSLHDSRNGADVLNVLRELVVKIAAPEQHHRIQFANYREAG